VRPVGALAVLAAVLTTALPSSAWAAAPVPLGPRQEAALRALSGYVTRLVSMTQTIGEGVEVPQARIASLRTAFVRWNAANRRVLGTRLATPRTLGVRGVTVLDAVERIETVGGLASTARMRSAVASFDATAAAFARMRFTRASTG
jgi:hypothetical protein